MRSLDSWRSSTLTSYSKWDCCKQRIRLVLALSTQVLASGDPQFFVPCALLLSKTLASSLTSVEEKVVTCSSILFLLLKIQSSLDSSCRSFLFWRWLSQLLCSVKSFASTENYFNWSNRKYLQARIWVLGISMFLNLCSTCFVSCVPENAVGQHWKAGEGLSWKRWVLKALQITV